MNNLIILGFSQLDSEIFLIIECEIKTFLVPDAGHLLTDKVAHLIEELLFSCSLESWEEWFNVIISVGNADVFDDITFVENIGTDWGNMNLNFPVLKSDNLVLHSFKESNSLSLVHINGS